MARYGGGEEDFKAQQARLNAMADKLAAIEAKEAQAAAAMDDLGAATDKATSRRQVLNRAKKESADITAREEAVSTQEASAINIDTQAIERNRVARERRLAVSRAEQINVQRAFRGAQDPLFAQASASSSTTQAALRRELGIGAARARALQEARNAPFLTPGNAGATAPFTQSQSAQIGLTQAERELTQANRALASLKSRSAAVTEQEIATAIAQRDAAQQNVVAAKSELESIGQLTTARREAAVAESRAAEAAAVNGGAIVVRNPQIPTQGGGTQPYTGVRTYAEAVEPGLSGGVERTRAEALAAVAAEENRAAAAAAQRAAIVAAEESALAGLTVGERAYIATLDKESAAAVLSNRERAVMAAGQIQQRVAAETGALQREGAALGSVSQAMYKHGALTQEFILAAGRGEVTLRELGNQALVTAGKFGGWTAAATAVFGVARALGDVVKGAAQAQTAQANLSRFIPGQTQDQTSAGLVQVSREVNAPIEDVSQTQQTFARVFKNQADSLIATSTALKAYKLDQIDAADSTRYFTSISQEFNLNAKQLPGLFDQISAAQRNMGARVAENLPAIARSAAAVKNAGGDLTQLVALTATAQVASGQTGNVVGTAFSRAASNFSQRPANKKIIESFGIDASQGFTQMLIESVRRSQTLTGEQRTELAKAIGGPQYGGRIFQSLLGQQDRLTKARSIVDPANAAGSANEELRKKLQGVDEMVKRLGTDLQQLGVELAQTGAFDFAGVLLKGTDELLHVVTLLIGEFDKIPQPLREGLSVLGEMAVAVKLLQRFAPASLLGTNVGRAIGGPELGQRQRIIRGLRDTKSGLADEADRTQREAFRATRVQETQGLAAQRAVAERDRLLAASAEGDIAAGRQLAAADIEVARTNAAYSRAVDKATLAVQSAEDTAALAAAADEEYAAARKLTAAELRASNVFASRELGVPSYAGVARTATGESRTDERGFVIPPGGVGAQTAWDRERAAREAESDAARALYARGPVSAGAGAQTAWDRERAAREAQSDAASALYARGPVSAGDAAKLTGEEAAVVEGRAASMQAGVTRWSGRWQQAAGKLRAGGRVASAAVGATETAVKGGIAASERAASGLAGAGRSIGALASSLGPLDIAIVGFIGLTILGDKLKKLQDDFDKTAASVTAATPTQSALEAHRRNIAALARPRGETAGETFQHIGEDINPINLFSDVTGIGGYQSPYERRLNQITGPAMLERRNQQLIEQNQARAADRGGAIPQQTYDQLQRRVEGDAKLRQQGIISQREFDHRMALHAIEAKTLLDPTRQDVEAASQLLADASLRSPGRGYAQSLKGLGGKQLIAQATALSDRINDLGPSKTEFAHLEDVYLRQASFYSGGSSTGIAALSTARQAYYKAITDSVQNELKLDTGAGSTESERQSAYARAASQYSTHILGVAKSQRDSISSRLKQAQAAQKAADAALSSSGPDDNFGIGGLGQLPGEHSNALKDAADAARKRVRDLKSGLKHANDEVAAAEREYRTLISDLRDSRFNDRQSSRQTDLALLQSESPNDPVRQAREAVDEAQRQVADARRTYGVGTDPYKQAVTALNNARTGITAAIKSNASDIINAETALAQAQTTDPLAQARIAESGARQLLGVARTHLERLQAQTSLAQAQQQVQDAIKAQNDANFTLLESLTTDPIKQADLERQRTKRDIPGTTGANRLTAKADYNKAIQAERDARLTGREDTIDFEQTMGRITIQDAISRYDDLLKIRTLTKQQRRDILTKVHALQQQSESEATGFNLDVGTIKLPTALDIKRAFDPVRRQVKASQRSVLAEAGAQTADITNNVSHMYDARSQVQAHVQVIVNDKNAANEVYSAIDRALGTNVRARMRSRGLRG